MRFWTYILRCNDGSYYTGSYRGTHIEDRIHQHDNGTYGGYTSKRCPVTLIWCEEFQSVKEAIRWERQIKGWSRAKKEALVKGDIDELKRLSNSS